MAERKEIGVIPYVKTNNSYRYVIVSTRKSPSKWIFPKGQPESDRTDEEIAVNEAFEEAGIIGTIRSKPIKISVEKKQDTIVYKFYPFRISKICRRWPERKIRSRRFVKEKKALVELQDLPYAKALEKFIKKRL